MSNNSSTLLNTPKTYPAKAGYLTGSILEIFSHEHELLEQGYEYVIGIDEAGRGPLAGPVTAAAVVLRKSQIPNPNIQTLPTGRQVNSKAQIQNSKQYEFIRDSKTLSEKQREKMFDFIHEYFHVGIGICDHKTIDRINVLEATFLAMKSAVSQLKSKIKNQNYENTKYQIPDTKYILLIDGNKVIPNFSMEQKAVINGDKLVKSISAASIIAKVTRDRMMRKMHEKYPEYYFNRHKGYGTKAHMEAIRDHGPCPIHRMSFEPLKSWTKKQ
jgi:ribonuclease HII